MTNKYLSIFLMFPVIAMSLKEKGERDLKFSSANFRDGIGYVKAIDLGGLNSAKMNLSTLISNIMKPPSNPQHKLVFNSEDNESLSAEESLPMKTKDKIKEPLRLSLDVLARAENPFDLDSDSDSDEAPVMRNSPSRDTKVFLQYDIEDDLDDDFLKVKLKK